MALRRAENQSTPLSFWPAYLAGAAVSFLLVRRAGWHRLVREDVSARGGNHLAFVLIKAALRAGFAILGPLDVQGQENVPRNGPFILTPNHTSDCDVLALGAALPRWGWYVAKEELFSIAFVSQFMTFVHAFPIRRAGPADRAAMKQILGLLSEGEVVVIFPEGHLSQDGVLQEFQPGTAMLALRAGVPVVPAAMSGTRNVLPWGEVIPRPSFRRVRIRFGKPIDLSSLPEEDRHERLRVATERIRQGVVELLKVTDPEYLSPEDKAAAPQS